MRRIVLSALLFFLTALPVFAQPPNLLSNGDFDTDLSSWTITGDPGGIPTPGDPASVSHQPGVDALSLPGSGAVLIDSPSEFTSLIQCVQLPQPLTSMTAGVAFQGDVDAALILTFFTDTSCVSPVGTMGGPTHNAPGPDFSFRLGTYPLGSLVPPGANSARVMLAREATGAVQTHYDKAFLVQGLPSEQPPHTATIQVEDSTDLTIDLSGLSTGGISPFERRFQWNFGDGNFGEGATVSHTYAAPGTYLIFLQADSGFDGSAFDSIEVTVPAPVSTPTAIPTASETGLLVLVLLLAMGGAVLLRSTS